MKQAQTHTTKANSGKKMGPLLPNTGNKSQAIILVEHDQVLKHANLIPGVFNDFFSHPPGP